ncbi:putative F-box domain-containing protein [Seiridium cardinale]|uniref:F-box domain-containing protein n=1 Tax=Seiridium cardinale TaxID=138064 RepID=A0ABR2Y3P6_9PEZI
MPSFLDLPLFARQRIYAGAGLVLGSELHLDRVANTRLLKKQNTEWERALGFCDAASVVAALLNLMLTCRNVHDEIIHLLFSTNQLHISDLQRLRGLSPLALSSLRSLSLTLNACTNPKRIRSTNYCKYCQWPGDPSKDRLLNASIPKDQDLLLDWADTAQRIGPCITPSSLNLRLVSDVIDEETARLVVRPFLHLPVLFNCELRLGHKSEQLQELAKLCASRATGNVTDNQTGFPFLKLSTELRLKILEFTDLVTPLSRVEWSEENGYYILDLSCDYACEPPYDGCHPDVHKECATNIECKICSHESPARNKERGRSKCFECGHYGCQFCLCRQKARGTEVLAMCFCHRWHSSYSASCRCWQPPTPLFVVCKSILQDARAVFFSKNQFIVGFTDYLCDHFSPFHFFSDAVPDGLLRHIRSLQLYFRNPDQYEPWSSVVGRITKGLTSLRNLRIDILCEESVMPSCAVFPYRQTLPWPSFSETAAIDIVKKTVDQFWPIDDLESMPRLNLFVAKFCLFEDDDDLERFIFYRRRCDEPLPRNERNWSEDVSLMTHFQRPIWRNRGSDRGLSIIEDIENVHWMEGIALEQALQYSFGQDMY